MQSTPNPKQSDDPHDFVVVAPDAVTVAPAHDEIATLLHDAARHLSESQTRTASGFPACPPVPPVDTTFRPAAVDDVEVASPRRSIGRGAVRAFTALLLAGCIGATAFAWRSWGDAAEKKVATWATQFVMTASLPPEKSDPSAQAAPAAVQADAANAAPAQPTTSAQSAVAAIVPTAAAASPDSAQLLQSMARDLASLGQEVEQLKASIEQIKASQQTSRDAARASEAKASEQNLRPRISAPPPPPRPAVARAPKPPPPLPPMQAAAPALPQAGAPYYAPRQPEYQPRQIEPQPQGSVERQADPELESVPRPPMPVR